ncbi:MAG: phosphatidylserine decarboxylase [Acidimicrobiia bacterium]|nr:phosphatidylserine decarboxylase [Acidimicrobiia bacterium]
MRKVLIGLSVGIGILVIAVRAYERWWFPRDPERAVDPSARVVAPADGRIVYVAHVEKGAAPIAIKDRREIPIDEIVKGDERPPEGTLIGIFMSPFDVHHQRSPIAGTVTEVTYHPAPHNHVMGSMFLRNLIGMEPLHVKSPHIYDNERNVIRIDGEDLSAYVVQIADQQVNKIDCTVGEGQPIGIGDRIGMIRRGSQVDLFVPGLRPGDFPALAVGAKVYAGSTVLLS